MIHYRRSPFCMYGIEIKLHAGDGASYWVSKLTPVIYYSTGMIPG